jgi:uncharacterized protein YdgA (DUF945 family)
VKRSIVITLVLLALVILISPGIVGRLAENNLEQGIEWAKSDNPEVVVTTEKFQRGWFTSEGTHRIALRRDEFAALGAGNSMPSLIIETRFDHGLVPVSSMSLSSGSLKPGLARMVSTLHIDDGSGKLTDIPGTVFSETSLGGETTGRYVLEAGSRDDEGGTATWSGAQLDFIANNANRELSLKGAVQPWSYRSGADEVGVGLVTIDASQHQSDFGFPVGELSLEINSLAVAGAAGPVGGFQKLTIDGTLAINDQKLDAHTTMSMQRLAVPGVGEVGLSMDATVSDLDAASVGRISKALNEARSTANPQAPSGDLFAVIQKDLESLLAAGGEFRFDRLDVALPQGEVRSKLRLTLAETSGDFSWPSAILALKAAADIEVPEDLVELGRQMNPQAGSLVDMGFLQQNGDVYRMQAEFSGGLLTVNGVPMPMPFPGR